MNQNEHDGIKRAQVRLRENLLSRCIQSVRILFALSIVPVATTSCAMAIIKQTSDEIYIAAGISERVYINDDQVGIIGTFELVNMSSSPICFNEDIILNELSPYISVSNNNRKQDGGIPHPPVTVDIAQLNPGDRREFRRVVGYKTSPSANRDRYTISIQLWECNTSRPFVRHATLVG